jgi:chromosome segregation ATPase
VQVAVEKSALRKKAAQLLREASVRGATQARPGLDFITLAMEGKVAGFEKVIKMIYDMVSTIKKEQLDDEHKKEYCAMQFDFAEDKKKGLTKSVSDLEIAIEQAQDGVTTLAAEIEALEDGIKALDKAVAEATEQRKEEHEDYVELMASDNAAKELLKFAMNRLNKFYNPKLYKAPPKRVLSEEDQITVNMGGTLAPTAAPGGIAGTGIAAFAQTTKDAPAPPPESVSAYKKKSEDSGGVIAMVNLLIKDLDKEMQEAEVSEKDAQADYEKMLGDSAEKRAGDTKALTDKTAAKAALASDLEADKESKVSTVSELMATEKYISSLHGECDWLLQYFDARTAARTTEIDNLTTAKAVLSGADFSLLEQTHQKRTFLRKKFAA